MSEKEVFKEDHPIKRTIADSVFTNLFGTKKYLLQFYLALHPEDADLAEDDLEIVTIENVLTDGQYNDLGATVRGDKILFLCEAQSTWSLNVLIRILMYVAETYSRYCQDHDIDLYKSKIATLPKPELYVLFTGERKNRPAEISLRNDYFKDSDCPIDIKVRMIYDGKSGDIINQYVTFTRICQEQIRLHGRTRKAIEEVIRICKDQQVLAEYLAEHEKEVVDIMGTLFGAEEISRIHDVNIRKEGIQVGLKRGRLQQYIEDCQEFKRSKDEVVASITMKFDLSDDAAKKAIEDFWKET